MQHPAGGGGLEYWLLSNGIGPYNTIVLQLVKSPFEFQKFPFSFPID